MINKICDIPTEQYGCVSIYHDVDANLSIHAIAQHRQWLDDNRDDA